MRIKLTFASNAVLFTVIFLSSLVANADDCDEYLKFSDEDRGLAAIEVLTNATPTQKMTLAVMLSEACRGGLQEFSKEEANKDAAVFLPYLRQMKKEGAKLK